MSFSGMGSWKAVDTSAEDSASMPPPARPPVNSSLKRADEVMASLGKSRVKSKASEWNWEDEEMMYEVNRRNLKRQKRKLEASKVTVEEKKEKRTERQRERYAGVVEERKLFLGGLADETTERDIKEAFEPFGTLVDLKVMRDNDTGKSRNYGFLTYAQVS
jgi:hypothetical protein